MSEIRHAHCLCGGVRFKTRLKDNALQACHCEQCQRWTGGGPLWTVRTDGVPEVNGTELIRSYFASDHGERAFCSACGTTLYWKMKDGEIAFLPVGLFEDQNGFEVREEIFVDRRPGWMPAWAGATQQDEAEMQAALKAYLEGDAR